jgi:energy-coupling factor transporter ATP-binding protein EcfA2
MVTKIKLRQTIQKWFKDPKNAKAVEAMTEQEGKTYDEEDVIVIKTMLAMLPTSAQACKLGSDVLSDLEMFASYRHDGASDTLFSTLDKSILNGTKVYLKHVIQNPVSDSTTIQRRQMIVRSIDPEIVTVLLKDIAAYEQDLCWLFANKEEHVKALEDMLFFRVWLFQPLNKSSTAVTSMNIYKILLSPLIGILSPILYFVIPYYIIRWRYKINIGFINYVKLMLGTSKLLFEAGGGWTSRLRYVSYMFSLIFYFQGIFNSMEISQTMYKLNKFVLGRVDNILDFLSKSHDILKDFYNDDIPQVFFGTTAPVPYAPHNLASEGQRKKPHHRHWLTTNFGSRLAFLKTIDAEKTKTVVNQIYMIDVINSIARMHKELGFGFCEAVQGLDKPFFDVKQVWHPSINREIVVRNDMMMNSKRNAILTGPNAGGKSTLVKSVLLSVLLAQTLGVVNAEELVITPFSFINSQISIPDCKGKESLFEAEMHRCKYNLEHIRSMEDGFSFVIMDEIFNSTNPIEGISGAYAIAKSLGALKSSVVMFTTHYTYLTRLQKDTKRFINYKMDVNQSETGFVFPYRLSQGVSKQYIALDLLRSKGFRDEIVEEALRIKNKLTRV